MIKRIGFFWTFLFVVLFCSKVSGQSAQESVSLQGKLLLEYEDYDGHAKTRFWVKDTKGNKTELELEKIPSWLKGSEKIKVKGKRKGKKVVVEEGAIDLMLSEDSGAISAGATASAGSVSGSRTILAVEVHPPVKDDVQNDKASIEDMLFNQANSFFQEASYGKVSLSGFVADPVIADYDTSVCDTNDLAARTDAILRSRGIEPNNYDHIMYFIPWQIKCTWSGKGNVNGPRTWIKRFQASVINHELGHNLGLFHANKKDCGSHTTLLEGCTIIEYGDSYSGMGSSNSPSHFNGFHKEQLGWLDGQVATLSESGSITLSVMSKPVDGNPKVLKVFKGLNNLGNPIWYYLEYRKAYGFDAENLASRTQEELSGIRLREGTGNFANSSYLLDITPESTTYDWDDITILPGAVYTDELSGLSIAVESSDDTSVLVTVNYGTQGGGCVRYAPNLTNLSPDLDSASPGASLSLSYLLENKDTQGCSSEVFNLSSIIPSGWQASLDKSSVTLSPGSSSTVILSAVIPQTAAEGDYVSGVSAARTSSQESIASTNHIHVVAETSNRAPVAQDDIVNITDKSSVVIDALLNDSDPDGDTINFIQFSQGSKGSVGLNADGTFSYVPSKSFKSSDSFTYTISDGSLTSVATVQIKLSGGGSGGGGSGGGGRGKNK